MSEAASPRLGFSGRIASAFQATGLDALLIVAPRHPERGAPVAALLTAQGFKTARRGAGDPLDAGTQAYVADTLGEMGLLFRAADVAVMGGSFVPDIGGHNPLEPARLGVPIVTGPHIFNAAAIYAHMFIEVAANPGRLDDERGAVQRGGRSEEPVGQAVSDHDVVFDGEAEHHGSSG